MNALDLSFNLLRSIGVFYPSTSSKCALTGFNVYRGIVLVLLVAMIILMTVQLSMAPKLSQLARTIDFWTFFLSGAYKWSHMTTFNNAFAELKSELDKIQAQGSAVYGPTIAHQFTTNYLKQMQRVTAWYFVFGVISASSVMLNPLVSFPKRDRPELEYFNDPMSYPFYCWIPFMIEDYWIFSLWFAFHVASGYLVVFTYLGSDAFMFGAIYTIGGQIELLNSTINTIENSIAADQKRFRVDRLTYFTGKEQNRTHSMLRECVKHHILIHHYIKKISTDFSSLIIVDYLHGMTSLTFALFQLSISGGIGESISLGAFTFISVFHQFLNNYFGEHVIQKQLSVGLAAYDVPWWRVDKKSRYILTLMILRSNNPTVITGLYMYKLCNNSFIVFVKALYSYYMVLRRVNVEDKNA